MRRHRTTPLFLVICTLASGCGPHNSRKPPQGTSYRETSVSLRNPHDGIRLAGSLTLPQGPGPFPAVVLVHGSGPGTRDLDIGGHRPFRVLADYLSRRDVAVLRYDKRGVGQSEGRLEPYDLERITQDALAGVSFLKAHEAINTERIGALGISQGGMIVPMMATRSPDMAFIVVLSGPGVWGKEFFCLSSIAIARASGFGDREFTRIRELYDKMWPLYTKATLSTSETDEAKRLLGDIASFMEPETRRAFSLTDVDAYFAFMRSPRLLESLDHDPATVLSRVRCPVLAI
ncbi:MAG: alpha/beta hydrolase, partial [bacterium]|nr:alpha/beta hydrolase [bacterium]